MVLSIIIIVTMFVTVRTGKLTLTAALTGGFIGIFIFKGADFTGIAMMAIFFILGTLATAWKAATKAGLGVAEDNSERRTAGQVLANAGVAGIVGAYIWFLPEQPLIPRLMMAASFSAATADTLSSELGNVYGSRYYNIISLKKDQRGLNGVISVEGTLFGIVGSIIIAAVYSIGFGWNINFLWIVIAGTIGNLADSILGATLERKRYLNNNAVNFLNTLIGAVAAAMLGLF
ncbi:MAG: DUF92 domain-containing protein [Chitinophagaceae bacterium]